jgi:peptidoglycan/LPS O-acetylase OafA/YrhL
VLRFLAAFMVVIVHGYSAILGWEGLPQPLRRDPSNVYYTDDNLNSVGLFLKNLIQNFDLGVEFFFLISGFLITYLMLSEKRLTNTLNIPKFYMRRLLRIWPLYFLILAITPFIAHWTNSAEPHYWWNIFFANNFVAIRENLHEPGLQHFWSICVEEHFYLIWPVLIYLTPTKKLPVLFAGVILISVASRWFYFYTNEDWLIHTQLNTICRMDTLAIGSWIAWRVMDRPFTVSVSGWIRAMVYATLIMLLCFDNSHQTDSFFLVAFKRLVYTAFFSFLLLNYLFNPSAWFNFKKKNVLHYLGKVSFGIYMYHNILFGILFQKILLNNQLTGFWIFWVIYLAIVVALAVLSYELFEKHILKLKDRFAIIQTHR